MVWFLSERLKILHFPFWDCALKFSKEKASVTALSLKMLLHKLAAFPSKDITVAASNLCCIHVSYSLKQQWGWVPQSQRAELALNASRLTASVKTSI